MESSGAKNLSAVLEIWLTNLSKTGRSRKQVFTVFVDTCLVVVCLWAAYSLRFGQAFTDFRSTWYIFLVIPICSVIIFMCLGIYRWVIRSSNASLTKQLFKASILASVFFLIFIYLLPPERNPPRSLFIIFGMLLLLTTSGVRFLWQALFGSGNSGEPVAIYGAGQAGRQLLHSLDQGSEFRPVLFLDDNPMLIQTTVGGIPVVEADTKGLESKLRALDVERVILAMPSINAENYKAKVELIRQAGVSVQTIPTHSELVSGNTGVGNVRDISISDLLGRSEVPPDAKLLSNSVKKRSVLVTGGGGSIGSELCRQILNQTPSCLVIVDHSEENLYRVTEEFKSLLESKEGQNILFKPLLYSILDKPRIDDVMSKYRIETVFHAAAYKHVPIIEEQPEQGVSINTFGTLSVLDSAIKYKVKNFVLISTDKAVRPSNAMGASKRVAELILQAKAKQNPRTRISMVRFGNVLGSSGSVVPKFKKQIKDGGPITLTDPNITRYFMSIPEAAQLVLQSSAIAVGGDVFVLDMGEPHRIEDLAISMVKMSGKQLRQDTGNPSDIEIVIEGLRPGEKMYEELFITGDCKSTCIPKVHTAEEAWLDWDSLEAQLKQLELNLVKCDRLALKKQLMELAFSTQVDFDRISSGRVGPKSTIKKQAKSISVEHLLDTVL